MKAYKRALTVFIAVLLAALYTAPCFAALSGGEKECRVAVSFADDGRPVPGARFDLFFVASVGNAGGSFTPSGDFKSCSADLNSADSETRRKTALTLYGCALRDGIKPLCSGVTDENGALTLPGENKNLSPGLYLLSPATAYVEGDCYVSAPCLIALPFYDESRGEYFRSVSLSPKFERFDASSDYGSKRTVIVEWHGDEKCINVRPRSVTVLLFRDGEVFDSVELNAENSWRHTWTDFDIRHCWIAVEDGAVNYRVLADYTEAAIFINNIYYPEQPQEETTAPGTGETTASEEPSDLPEKPENPTRDGEELPDTGVLWWPVTVFAGAGLLLFIAGWAILRRYEYYS